MSSWEKWLSRPQSLWLRKALFQVHLWTGIGIGLYVLLMSVSGSALVYRRQLAKAFSQEPRIAAGPGARMTVDELKQAAKREYPGYESIRVYERKSPDQPVEIWLERGEKRLQRLFNPYTGADLGDTLQPAFRFILWLADLHDNLLYDRTGRRWNAIGAVLTTLLCLTGAIIWWPGIYLCIPETFNAVVDFFEPIREPSKTARFGDQALFWLARLHFGRFAGLPVEIIWTIFGLAPAALFVTGTLMWWKRVLGPWMRRKLLLRPQIDGVEAPQSDSSIHA